jgi:ATP-dependent Lon protease
MSRQALVPVSDLPPTVLPTVVLDDLVPFPGSVVPILLDSQARRDAVLNAKSNNGFLGLINPRGSESSEGDPPTVGDAAASMSLASAMSDGAETKEADLAPADEPGTPPLAKMRVQEVAPIGVLGRVLRVFQLPDDRLSALVQLTRRMRPVAVLRDDPFVILRVLYPIEVTRDDKEAQATLRQVHIHLQQFFEHHPTVPEEMKAAALHIMQPAPLSDFVGQHLSRGHEERLSFLCELDLCQRLRDALQVAIREVDLVTVGNRITEEIRRKVEKTQRDYFLREQLKAIRQELGEEKDPTALAVDELRNRLQSAALPTHAQERADEELARLQLLPAESPEHNVIRSYLDWIAALPWSKSDEEITDLSLARQVLDEDHYGLEEVKDRILEFLAVRRLNPGHTGSLLCFAGPPGVGKTSLGQSIARATGRKFYRFSVGGMRDEAEIKGHRRTYVGAMPGRILQALKQVGANNPVIMLDEIDKMGSDWRGDPSSALLEVLDPAQNESFLDHYLDLRFDLRKVMFICTANIKAEMPGPLLDRLEVIDLPGYIPEEKLEIAHRYLVPRQRKAHGLKAKQLHLGRPVLRQVTQNYTREAGVRDLERHIRRICRKRATAVVEGREFQGNVRAAELLKFLGPKKVHDERVGKRPPPGVAIGLAWTPMGGDVLFIEAVRMQGKGLKVTGHLGEVMSESAALALSYVRSHTDQFFLDGEYFEKNGLHIHFPAGAVRKDGPSAGVTITTALLSLLCGRSIRSRLAMTGEMTLRGDVLPVGGIREKVVAARRAGVRRVVVPAQNRADVDEIPEIVRARLQFVFAERYDDVFAAAFGPRS